MLDVVKVWKITRQDDHIYFNFFLSSPESYTFNLKTFILFSIIKKILSILEYLASTKKTEIPE